MWKIRFARWANQVFSPDAVLRDKYRAFKKLLDHDRKSHLLLAELESLYYDHRQVDFHYMERIYNELAEEVKQVVISILTMNPIKSEYRELLDFFRKIDAFGRFFFQKESPPASEPLVTWLRDPASSMESLAGGKASHLAVLGNAQIPIPEGFVITTRSFYHFLMHNDLGERIRKGLSRLDAEDQERLHLLSEEITELIREARIPRDLEESLKRAMDRLRRHPSFQDTVALRSSAVGEDSRFTFAGQYMSLLGVDPASLPDAYKKVISSKYSVRALSYRIRCGLADHETPMAVLVLPMINALASGVAYSRPPEEPTQSVSLIHAVGGLGEPLVAGETSPDVFLVERSDLASILSVHSSSRPTKNVLDEKGRMTVVPTTSEERSRASLSSDQAMEVARWTWKIEDLFGLPQDVEWCYDPMGKLIILQSRPLHAPSHTDRRSVCTLDVKDSPVLISGGRCASPGMASGRVQHLRLDGTSMNIPKGSVLVHRHASPDLVPFLDRAVAVVTDFGSTAGHLASVAREFAIPTLVDTRQATLKLPEGLMVTVLAQEGKVLEGRIEIPDEACDPSPPEEDSSFRRILRYVLRFTSPLELTDPSLEKFAPRHCRSFHDIVRYCHEKAVFEMFRLGSTRFARKKGAYKLSWNIPLNCYVFDVGGGIDVHGIRRGEVPVERIVSRPMQALWKGLSHPGIHWSGMSHFNWADYDRAVMSGGIVSADSVQYASYAVVGRDYVNMNLKFGYHFVIVDAFASHRIEENYVSFRFTGGGANYEQRTLRAEFLRRVLARLDFKVSVQGDLIDAQFLRADSSTLEDKLQWLGRLLGATRLMDMYLHEMDEVPSFVDEFMAGRHHFAPHGDQG